MCSCGGEALAAPSASHSYVQALLSAEGAKDVVAADDMGSAELLPHTGVVFLTGATLELRSWCTGSPMRLCLYQVILC